MSGHRPRRIVEASASGRGQIANLLRMAGVEPNVSRVSYTSELLPGLAWELVDTGNHPMTWRTTGDEVIHILHAMNELNCRIEVDGIVMPIAPGDTIRIGSPSSVQLSDGVLFVLVRSDGGTLTNLERPSHGTESFDGFNRRMTYVTGTEIAFERWKLTVPLDLDMDQATAFVVIFGHVSIIDSTSVETLGPGESVVYTGDRLRIVPDGLAYVAIVPRGEATL